MTLAPDCSFSASDFASQLPDKDQETGAELLEELAKKGTLYSTEGITYRMPREVLNEALEKQTYKWDVEQTAVSEIPEYPCVWFDRCKKEAEIFSGEHGDWCTCCWNVIHDPTSEEYKRPLRYVSKR